MASFNLAPLPQAMAVFGGPFVRNQTTTLVLKEGMFGSFEVKDLSGMPVLRVEGHMASIHARKDVYDMHNNYLFEVRKELMHWHSTCAMLNQNQQKLVEVKNKFALLGTKDIVTFTNAATGQPVSLLIKGDSFKTSAEITDEATGAIVARIDRKLLNAGELLFGHQTYHLTVAPGADLALLVGICVCLDTNRAKK